MSTEVDDPDLKVLGVEPLCYVLIPAAVFAVAMHEEYDGPGCGGGVQVCMETLTVWCFNDLRGHVVNRVGASYDKYFL
jgi:hypothetical protein